MKIFTQDKKKFVDIPKELWVTDLPEYSLIVGKCYIEPCLGIYKTADRAAEVFKEMINNYNNGAVTYCMPAE